MIGIDSNVPARYVMQDDPQQARLATRFIESRTPNDPGYISIVALAETVWVLKRIYHASREDLAEAVEHLLTRDALIVEASGSVHRALSIFRRTEADFAAALLRCWISTPARATP